MSVKSLKIKGLRGFSEEANIEFAIPDGKTEGSGLTIIVGPNNSGKSTIIEAFHLISSNDNIIPSYARNEKTDKKVYIEVEDTLSNKIVLKSIDSGGAFVEIKYNNKKQENYNSNFFNTFILSNKRDITANFYNSGTRKRNDYGGNTHNKDYRNETNQGISQDFGGRLLKAERENRLAFDKCLNKILNPLPNWTLESNGRNNLFLQFDFDGIKHSSTGSGNGFINLFNIVDALYDSEEDNVIIIDEPEISLHPDLQRKLFKLLAEYSKNKQIIISTHSPYFIDWKLISEKTKIIRTRKEKNVIKAFELSEETKNGIKSLIKDMSQPHILSLNANEIFFLNDNVIVVEGQDDVICYNKIFEINRFECNASFFGWGAGGAPKIHFVLDILKDLGYKKVFVLLDNDKKDMIEKIEKKYNGYKAYAIPTHDVRKKERDNRAVKLIKDIEEMEVDNQLKEVIISKITNRFKEHEGLIKDFVNFEINQQYQKDIELMLDSIKMYFGDENIINEGILEKEKRQNKNNQKENKENEERLKAEKLLKEYLDRNKINQYIENKYKYLEFRSGGGDMISFKAIKDKTFYAILEETEAISEKQFITIQFHFTIDISINKVKLIKKETIENTLPEIDFKDMTND